MQNLQTPEPLKNEHQEFKDQLFEAVKSGGTLGKVTQQLVDILNSHFKMEEEFAFPPLTLLLPLSHGEIITDMKNALDIIERFTQELPKLTQEHHEIIRTLEDFDETVRIERKIEFTQFSSRLIHHARAEEGILFPAAILIGEYLRLKL